jgi:hypothetical protein
MVWFRVNDGLFSDPKWSKTTNISRALWVTAGSWCAAYLTDGHVPRNTLRSLGGTLKAAQGLVDVGLWDETENGWSFHDWHEYNPLKETVLQERSATAERVAKHRARQQAAREGRNGVSTPAPPRAQSPTRPDPISTSMAGKTSSSYVSEREADDDEPRRQGWRAFATDTDVPPGVDPDREWTRFLERNGDGAELRDPAAAFRGWLRSAPGQPLPAQRFAPTPTPSRPECPDHPGQPTGSVACPECAATTGPPPAPLRILRDQAG